MARAAEEPHVTSAAISQLIKHLAGILGKPLLVRGKQWRCPHLRKQPLGKLGHGLRRDRKDDGFCGLDGVGNHNGHRADLGRQLAAECLVAAGERPVELADLDGSRSAFAASGF